MKALKLQEQITDFPYQLTNKRLKMDGLELLNHIPDRNYKGLFF